MPLNLSALQGGIQSVAASPADSASGCAQQWAKAVKDYATGIVPPCPAVAAAAAALEGALAGAFASPAAAPGMESAFAAFAGSVVAGMLPAFVGTPPSGPVGFANLFAGAKPETHAEAASNTASIIDSWMRTGSATPSGGGPPIPWS